MIKTITLHEEHEWDAIVQSFREFDIHYRSNYAKAFQVHGDGNPLLLYYENGNTRAMNVIMMRDIGEYAPFVGVIPCKTMYDCITPYGYGGFLVEGNDFASLNRAYDAYCIEHKVVCEFTRFHLLHDFQLHYEGIVESLMDNVICDLTIPFEAVIRNFDARVKAKIKKGYDAKFELRIESDMNGFDEFYRIYLMTMKRCGACKEYYFSREFFETICQMKDNYTFFYISLAGKVISAELVLFDNRIGHSFLGGTDGDYFYLCPNFYMKFQVLRWAHAMGLQQLVLGGGCGSNDGIFRFKKSFSRTGIYPYYIGKRIFDQESYEMLVRLSGKSMSGAEKGSFFPLYRA